jgi:hypothetical protein
MVSNIDASHTSTWNDGSGFKPIGDPTTGFTGVFNGNGYEIQGLTINRPSVDYSIGVFGNINSSSTISNVGVVNVDITGKYDVGGLAGYSNGEISNSYVTGSVTGEDDVGGLIGKHNFGTISNSYATGSVTGENNVGGLAGDNLGIISNSYATGSVTGENNVGGFVGSNEGPISNSYSTGSVTGDTNLGGFAGADRDGNNITDSYWDTESSGMSSSNGGTGLTTSEMSGSSAETNMSGFDFSGTWTSVSGDYPDLQ